MSITSTSQRSTTTASQDALEQRFRQAREQTETLCEPLEPEDYVLQSMPDASPPKWHLAHTTWFFETFLLVRASQRYQTFHPRFDYLFNSYYNAIGDRHPRPQRGLLSRPTTLQILDYRRHVDQALLSLLADGLDPDLAPILELGLHHEQQHQELLLTDLKHAYSLCPLFPEYTVTRSHPGPSAPLQWVPFAGGLTDIGFDGPGFCFDNEMPRHRVYLQDFALASRPVTCREYLAFVNDGGYTRPELWLSEGWDTLTTSGWKAPLYWITDGDTTHHFTLGGLQRLDLDQPVCHVSYFEADAYARWAGARLPTESEWEHAARDLPIEGTFLEDNAFHPRAASPEGKGLRQMFGDVWEWTASPYVPYPGYRPAQGALGEYNGKFMCSQLVLRGGSCVTPRSHIRPTYRNFFHPDKRWQFSGFRLAQDG